MSDEPDANMLFRRVSAMRASFEERRAARQSSDDGAFLEAKGGPNSAESSFQKPPDAASGATASSEGETSFGHRPAGAGTRLEMNVSSQIQPIAVPATSSHDSSFSNGDETDDKTVERVNPVRVLAELASGARLFRADDGRFFARVPVGDRHEIYGLRSPALRDWFINRYLNLNSEPPSPWALRRLIGMLEARARFNADIPEVFIRTARARDGEGSSYFIDLGDASGRAIAICERDWTVVDRPDVHFRRPAGLMPLPVPCRDGSVELLRPFVNLSQSDFRLLVTWLTAILRPVGPYPILVLRGEQATAKSTLVKIIRLLVDPHACIALNLPASARDMMVTAVNGWLLAYDNISDVPRWMSDALCQLVFGGAISGRALFTNDERSFIYAQRPVLLSGIGDIVRWGDLKDRCVFLQLPPIPRTSRRGEDEFWKAFHTARPRILGAMLDAMVGGLRKRPSVQLAELPRMADYAIWGEAVARGLGWPAQAFLSSYNANRKEATVTELLDSPLGDGLLQLGRRISRWRGSAAELNAFLQENVDEEVAASSTWPKTSEKFSKELRRLAPQLRIHGIDVNFERRHAGRIITLKSERVRDRPDAEAST
jgi:hypothetical protein